MFMYIYKFPSTNKDKTLRANKQKNCSKIIEKNKTKYDRLTCSSCSDYFLLQIITSHQSFAAIF